MRPLATWALVAALAVIGLAAAVDALRADADSRPAAPVRAETPVVPCVRAVSVMFRGEGGTTPCMRALRRPLARV
jgi:hypothetical protein